jgi:uncharacterized membrane protein YbhN (UPF0104 family)
MDRLVSVFGRLFFLPLAIPILRDALAGHPDFHLMMGLTNLPFVNLIRKGWGNIRQAIRLWLGNPKSLLVALSFSWLGVSMDILSTYTIALGQGLAVSLLEVAGIVALIHLVTIIPFSINAYGLRELTVVAALSQVGVSPEEAAALALVTRGIAMVTSFPGAFWIGSLLDDWRKEKDSVDSAEVSSE